MPAVSIEKFKILIVDDHSLVLKGMESVLSQEPDLEISGTAGSVAEALQKIEIVPPDLVVTDLTLPGRNGLELIKDLKALHPRIPVLVVSMHDEEIYAERVLRAGGRGYLMKESAPEYILDAIRVVLGGGLYISETTTRRFLDGMVGGVSEKPGFPLARLSDREIEVFEMIGKGKNIQEISVLLNIAVRTVAAHRSNIRKKLKLSDSNAVLISAVRWVVSGKAVQA